jgi:uncharacterized protein YdhG (YjbR/CyaY superfamily)
VPGQLSELRDLPPPAEVPAEGARVTGAAGDLGQRAGAGQDRVDRGGRGLLRAENLPDAHHGVFGEGRHGLRIGKHRLHARTLATAPRTAHPRKNPAQRQIRTFGRPLLGRLGWTPIRSGIEKRHDVFGPSLSAEGRHDTQRQEGSPRMPAENAKTDSEGFSSEERAAMKKRAAELRAEGKKGAKKADGLQAVLDSIAAMAPEDRALAERVHATVTAAAPELSPKTWYGMPAYANADGKVVVFFQDSGKFHYRYSTLGFQDAANLDDGDVWPVSYALKKWSPMAEKKVADLVKAAIS